MTNNRIGARVNVLKGLRIGVFLATIFSLGASVIWLVVGNPAFERLGVSMPLLVAVYFSALSLGGAAYGALLPLRRFAVGAMFLGVILVFPMYAALAVFLGLSLQRVPSVEVALTIGVILSVLVGGMLGLSEWSDERAKQDGGDRGSRGGDA